MFEVAIGYSVAPDRSRLGRPLDVNSAHDMEGA